MLSLSLLWSSGEKLTREAEGAGLRVMEAAGMFPLALPVAPGRSHLLQEARTFDRSLLPGEYFFDSERQYAHFSLQDSGLEAAFTESSPDSALAAALVIEVTREYLDRRRLGFRWFYGLFASLVEEMAPDEAFAGDEGLFADRFAVQLLDVATKELGFGLNLCNSFGMRLRSKLRLDRFDRRVEELIVDGIEIGFCDCFA